MAALTTVTGKTEVETLEASAGNVRRVDFDAKATHYEVQSVSVAATILHQTPSEGISLADGAANGGAEGFAIPANTILRFRVPGALSSDAAKRRIWVWSGTNSSVIHITPLALPPGAP